MMSQPTAAPALWECRASSHIPLFPTALAICRRKESHRAPPDHCLINATFSKQLSSRYSFACCSNAMAAGWELSSTWHS